MRAGETELVQVGEELAFGGPNSRPPELQRCCLENGTKLFTEVKWEDKRK